MTDATVTLRPAAASDADAIATLFTDEGYPAGPSDIVERLTRFGSEHSRVVVAEHEGGVLGFIAVHALPRFEHDDRILRVLALVVGALLLSGASAGALNAALFALAAYLVPGIVVTGFVAALLGALIIQSIASARGVKAPVPDCE